MSKTNKSGSPGLGAAAAALNHAYPDHAYRVISGDGRGFHSMVGIIHDFLSYNVVVQINFAHLLENKLSPVELDLIRRVATEAGSRGMPVYIVGGVPRDLALGRPVSDLDIVVEGDAIAVAKAMAARYGGRVTAHTRFGTAKWHFATGSTGDSIARQASSAARDAQSLDLISARIETYLHPAELPRVRLGSIEDDMRRRDFTINTLAIRLDEAHFGQYIDKFGALLDMERGSIRVLHVLSFRDDPTRMYRAVRYEQRYGFHIDAKTLSLAAGAIKLVEGISAQRIRSEFDLLLGEDRAVAMVERLGELRLLRPVHRLLPCDKATISRLRLADEAPALNSPKPSLQTLRWLVWLMGLSSKEIESIHSRMHFGSALFAAMLASSRLYADLGTLARRKPSKVAASLRRLPLFAVYAVCQAAANATAKDVLKHYLQEWRHVRSITTGDDLRKLGLAPGPVYEHILSDLRDARLDGLVRTKAEERKRLLSLLEGIRNSRSLAAVNRGSQRRRRGA